MYSSNVEWKCIRTLCVELTWAISNRSAYWRDSSGLWKVKQTLHRSFSLFQALMIYQKNDEYVTHAFDWLVTKENVSWRLVAMWLVERLVRNIIMVKPTLKKETIFSVIWKKLSFDCFGNHSRCFIKKRKKLTIFSNLVDPASSHTLVSKIKPCMCKYKRSILWNCEWLIISVIVYLIILYYLDNRSNSRANTCVKSWLSWKGCIY